MKDVQGEGTLRIPREDWGKFKGTLGKIRGITTTPLRILLEIEDMVGSTRL